MTQRTHIDLFSGIGGFALAAQANGIETIRFCEIDKRCREFLTKARPGVAVHDDIRTYEHAAANRPVFLLTAGVPCQPASRAGKQRGASDDRWLWPCAIETLRRVQPAWALFENPPGIGDLVEYGVSFGVEGEAGPEGAVGDLANRSGPGHLAQILEEIEQAGYAVQIYNLPACAVDAPHRRERLWIVCRRVADSAQVRLGETRHIEGDGSWVRVKFADECSTCDCCDEPWCDEHEAHYWGCECVGPKQDGYEYQERADGLYARRDNGCVGNAAQGGGESIPVHDSGSREQHREERQPPQPRGTGPWSDYVWLPCADRKVRRVPYDTQRVAHGLPVELLEALGEEGRQTPEDCEPHRSLLGALGNAIVWPVAARIIAAMVAAEEQP